MLILTTTASPPLRFGPPPQVPEGQAVADPVPSAPVGEPNDTAWPGEMLRSPALQWALAKNTKLASGLTLLSVTAEATTAGSDIAPMVMPFADGLAFTASGVSLAAKLNEGDHWGAAAAGVKLTGTVLSLTENYLFPGSTVLTAAATACKIGGMGIDLITPTQP